MAKREAKPVRAKPKPLDRPCMAIRWDRRSDWTAVCKFAGWTVTDEEPPFHFYDDHGHQVNPGDWLLKRPDGLLGMSDMEFRSRFIVENKHGKA